MTEEIKKVRWADWNDAQYLVTLNMEFNGEGMTSSEVEKSLAHSNEFIALAILDEVPVGFACAQRFASFCYRDAQGEITELYIQEHARNKGLAKMLIAFLEERLRQSGVKSVKILTGKYNESAHKTYESSNYRKKEDVTFYKML